MLVLGVQWINTVESIQFHINYLPTSFAGFSYHLAQVFTRTREYNISNDLWVCISKLKVTDPGENRKFFGKNSEALLPHPPLSFSYNL